MKTVKIKVELLAESLALIPGYKEEMEWLWNKCLYTSLHNRCLDWYKWARKTKAEAWGLETKGRKPGQMDGIIETPLYFGKRSAYMGATCRIAVGGLHWKKDKDPSKVIHYRVKKNGKWEPRTKHVLVLVKGDKPYESIKPQPHVYPSVGGKEIKNTGDLDRKGSLGLMRAEENLSPISAHSDYVGGLIKDFDVAWKAYLDPKLSQRYKPKYKDGKQSEVTTFSGPYPPKLEVGRFTCKGLIAQPRDRSWQKRLGNLVPRSYKLTHKPSGWYLCVSAAYPSEAERPTAIARRNKIAKAVKKGIVGKDAQQAALDASLEYQAAVTAIADINLQIEIDRYMDSPCSRRTGKIAGIDPGVKAIVATDHGALFRPNVARGRVAAHIKRLKSKLGGMVEANDRRFVKRGGEGQRPPTKNEAKLRFKISRLEERGANSSKAFNHKLATRLARTYDVLMWEATRLTNMMRGVDPKLSEDGKHYEKNNAAAKTALNYALHHACMGDLKAKVIQRMETARKIIIDVPAPGTSIECHACGGKGDRAKQEAFFCLNDSCKLYLIQQQADVNAAKNIKKRGREMM